MTIAILEHSTSRLVVIEAPEMETTKEVEDYLENKRGYALDEINYMPNVTSIVKLRDGDEAKDWDKMQSELLTEVRAATENIQDDVDTLAQDIVLKAIKEVQNKFTYDDSKDNEESWYDTVFNEAKDIVFTSLKNFFNPE